MCFYKSVYYSAYQKYFSSQRRLTAHLLDSSQLSLIPILSKYQPERQIIKTICLSPLEGRDKKKGETMTQAKPAAYHQVRSVLIRHFVRSGLIDAPTLDRVFDESRQVRSLVVAGAHAAKELRNHIEQYRRPLLIRLIGNELKRLTSNVGQRQDIDAHIARGIMLSKIEKRRATT